MSLPTWSERLVSFGLELGYADIPDSVVEAARLHVLDAIGIAVAAAASPTARTVRSTVDRLGGRPECTVIGSPEKRPAPLAALANAAMIHTPDFDDTHGGSVVHPSAVVLPAALAAAQAKRAGGKELLAAVVAGYEVMVRLGLAAPGRFHKRGFHPTALCGTFAAALAAAKLLGLGPETARNALGICGSQAAGLMEYLSDGSSTKQVHPGWSALSGIFAAYLAADGMTGPATVLEGPHGFYRAHLGEGEYDLEKLSDGLGRTWETVNISYKVHPCCHYLSAYVDCARALRAKHGLAAADVVSFECVVAPGQVGLIVEPLEAKKAPRTGYEAKFSLAYAVAVALMRGDCGLADFEEGAIRDGEVVELAKRFRYAVAETGYPQVFPGWLRVTTRRGTVLEHREPVHRGGPGNPVGADAIIVKFRSNAALGLPPDRAAGIEAAVMGLSGLVDAGAFAELLAFEAAPAKPMVL